MNSFLNFPFRFLRHAALNLRDSYSQNYILGQLSPPKAPELSTREGKKLETCIVRRDVIFLGKKILTVLKN